MVLRGSTKGYRVSIENGPKVCYQRPSVDVLFNSVAAIAGEFVSAALLTGMGADGARGLMQIKLKNGATVAQDEASCVVFGMPREAIRMGAAQRVLPLSQIAGALLNAARKTLAIK
jgi:two-component system chemotaxis response regulator CheB